MASEIVVQSEALLGYHEQTQRNNSSVQVLVDVLKSRSARELLTSSGDDNPFISVAELFAASIRHFERHKETVFSCIVNAELSTQSKITSMTLAKSSQLRGLKNGSVSSDKNNASLLEHFEVQSSKLAEPRSNFNAAL